MHYQMHDTALLTPMLNDLHVILSLYHYLTANMGENLSVLLLAMYDMGGIIGAVKRVQGGNMR